MISLNLKNKILFSSLAVILLVSALIALVARYVLISSLTGELEQRGLGIAHSIADRSTGLILTRDEPQLTSLVFEATQVGERTSLVSYIFILDTENRVLASTFITPFPDALRTSNVLPEGREHSIETISLAHETIWDVAVPVKEGIYDVGSVHVGLSERHIDMIISKLRIIFLGFICGIVTIMFFISAKLARNITKPINQLMLMADEISRDNLDFKIDLDRRAGEEILHLADSFDNMVQHIKEYRSEIKKSHQKYRSLFHSGPDPIFVLDYDDLRILDANPMASELYGFPRMELVGMPFKSLAPEFAEICMSAFQADDMDAMAGCVFTPKMLNYRNGDEPFYVNIHACSTIYEESPAIIVSTNDITDIIEKDAQLIQASKMKSLGEMSAGIAHEVNQPLNAIKLGSEYLSLMSERDVISPDKLQTVALEISSQVDRAADIITTLREFGRKADLTKDRLLISEPLQGVLTILRQQLMLENIRVELDIDTPLRPILAHRNRLEQVFFNLISNARDAITMHERCTDRLISVCTWESADRIFISVSDTGMGIPEQMLDKIFEPFYTSKEIGKGMGLGLAISYGIIKDYQGEIQVSSTPGQGTAFTLSFPAAEN